MVDTVCDWRVYRTPSNEILRNRRTFYGLQRRIQEPVQQWLKRIQTGIRGCEFPKIIEFLLIDRFVCGLNSTELKSIRRVHTWTLKQLMEMFLTQNIESDPIESNSAHDEYIIPNQILAVDLIKSEPVCTDIKYSIYLFTVYLWAK